MRKTVALLLALFFLAASCVMVAKPASSSADATEDSWASRAPMHVARSSLGVAAVNGKIYAIGGTTFSGMWPSESGGIVGTNEEYDPVKDAWASKTAMPTPRYDFAIAVYQSKIYCIGGSTGISSNGQVFTEANEVYDPATNTWETRAPMPTPRSHLTANVVNGKIYLIGGYVGNVSSGYSYLNLNSVYDPATDSWATKTPMPTASGSHASAVVDNKIYIIDSNLNQIYNPETDTWSLGAPPPSSVKHGAAGATTGVNAPKRIYLLGDSGTLVYDSINDCWTTGTAVPTYRQGFGVVVVNDVLYAVGGYTLTYPNMQSRSTGGYVTKYATNEQYTPFGYGTAPPVVQVVSPASQTYNESSVPLVFAVNKPVNWTGYSLDGEPTVTLTGNTTISGLTNGEHNVTVYANDTFENTGASETVSFSVKVPFPATLVIAPVAGVVVIGAVLAIYFKKRKH